MTGHRPVATKSCETASEKFSWQFDRSPQEAQVMVPGNFNAAKLLQVRGEPLCVEQHEFASAQMLHKRHERNLALARRGRD